MLVQLLPNMKELLSRQTMCTGTEAQSTISCWTKPDAANAFSNQ